MKISPFLPVLLFNLLFIPALLKASGDPCFVGKDELICFPGEKTDFSTAPSFKGRMSFQLECLAPAVYDIASLSKNITQSDHYFPGTYNLNLTTERTDMPVINTGIGIKFFPWDKTYIAVSYYPAETRKSITLNSYFTYDNRTPQEVRSGIEFTQAPVTMASLNRLFFVGDKIRVSAGAGILYTSTVITFPSGQMLMHTASAASFQRYFMMTGRLRQEQSFSIYTLNTGFDWKAGKRTAVSLSSIYLLGVPPVSAFDMDTTYYQNNTYYSTQVKIPVDVFNPDTNRLLVSLAVSYYF